MKPVKATKRDQFVTRRDETCGKMSLAEIDPDFEVTAAYLITI